MRNTYSSEIDASPEYVLAVLRDEHRQAVEVDGECDPDIDLTFDSTVADWRIANDLLPAKQLGRALNESWALSLSDTDWRNVLTPPRKRTLRDVTNLIALHTTRTQLQPLQIAGTSCLPAAAFLAIKDCLAADVVDVNGIAPSTPLHEYTRRHWLTFIQRISRLAPGALPPIAVVSRADDANTAIGCLGALLTIAGMFLLKSAPFVPVLGMLLLLITTANSFRIRSHPLDKVAFGDLRTFRDLSVCIAKSAG